MVYVILTHGETSLIDVALYVAAPIELLTLIFPIYWIRLNRRNKWAWIIGISIIITGLQGLLAIAILLVPFIRKFKRISHSGEKRSAKKIEADSSQLSAIQIRSANFLFEHFVATKKPAIARGLLQINSMLRFRHDLDDHGLRRLRRLDDHHGLHLYGLQA